MSRGLETVLSSMQPYLESKIVRMILWKLPHVQSRIIDAVVTVQVKSCFCQAAFYFYIRICLDGVLVFEVMIIFFSTGKKNGLSGRGPEITAVFSSTGAVGFSLKSSV